MASVFKRGRWVDADGKKCRKDDPGAQWAVKEYPDTPGLVSEPSGAESKEPVPTLPGLQPLSREPSRPGRTLKFLFDTAMGIDHHFTRGDRMQSYVLFGWTMLCFAVFAIITVWNLIHVWPWQWWAKVW